MICGLCGPRSRLLWEAIMIVYASIWKILKGPEGGSKVSCGLAGPRSRPPWEAIMFAYASICKDSEGSRAGVQNVMQTLWAQIQTPMGSDNACICKDLQGC